MNYLIITFCQFHAHCRSMVITRVFTVCVFFAQVYFPSAVKTNTLLTIDELFNFGQTTDSNDDLKITLFYQESEHLVAYIIKRYDMFHIKQLFEQFGKGKDSDAAIREVVKISPQKLEAEWKETFGK